MRVVRVLIVLCFVTFFMFSCQEQTIRVGIVGDQFGAYDTEKAFEIMQAGVLQLNDMSPDIVLHVGDMLETKRGIKNFDDYKKNYETAISIMSTFRCPWLLAVGDHDVVPDGFKALSEDRSKEGWFMDLIKSSQLPINDKPYYSYTYKGYHFVVLYSMDNLHTDPRWGSIFLNKINEEQLKWLKSDLEVNATKNGTIVLVHHPHWYVWQNWKPIHDVIKEYNTHAVIAGHYHYDQDEGEIDGIRYLVMGSSGGVIKETDRHTAAQEIAMLTISPRGIEEIQLKEINSKLDLEWTPRVSMDRIQALSCMLDNLWQDESLYAQNGHVYSSHDQKIVEKIDLESLVNPIDLPIKLHISYESEAINDPRWLIDDLQMIQDTVIFEPGYRSGSANYSTVRNWYTPSSVWQATIDNAILNEQGNVQLKIHVTFNDTKRREIEKTVNYYIKRN